MLTCRSIPSVTWEHARRALVFYFSRRHGLANAEDLAHDTLAALWNREDYEFENEEDFLRICYAFARRVSLAGYRQERKHAPTGLNQDVAAPNSGTFGLNSAEMMVFLDEVIRAGKAGLREQDWLIIQRSATSERAAMVVDLELGNANNARVRLHRARKKLARLTGWKSLL